MFHRNKLNKAIVTAIAASVAVGSAGIASSASLEEVIVTATKTEASTQDIPVAVSAVTSDTIDQLGITNFEDYLVQLPGVTAGGSGPGQNTIYIRGVASSTPNLTTSGVAGLAPNVALYLDEQPLAQPGRNLDVYTADMSRIEVLAGPQGTLYGASSQAGTVRLITNKPDPSGFFGKVKLNSSFTADGDPSNSVEAMINVPVNDDVTLRGVVYTDHQGGYIDNVEGTISTANSARFRPGGFQADAQLASGTHPDVIFIEGDNGAITEDNFNDVTCSGARAGLLWDIDDNWNLLLGVMTQTVDSEGVFFTDPDLDELEIQRYEDDVAKDQFTNVNWTLTGRMGALDVLYAGAFTDRQSDQRIDYTDYLYSAEYFPVYICDQGVAYPSYVGGTTPAGTCQAPNAVVTSLVDTEVTTHELRFSTESDASVRATFGGFYSELELREMNMFIYPGSELMLARDGITRGYGPNFSILSASILDPTVWPEGNIWRNDILRTDKQMGIFGELTMDISDEFAATFGARWYDIEMDLKGFAGGSWGNDGQTTDQNIGNDLDTLFSGENDVAAADGVVTKLSLSWTPSEDALIYVTFSEGFRPGFLNRPAGEGPADGSYVIPFAVQSDDLTNYELGWKSDLMDGSMRLNGSIFRSEIDNLQVGIFDSAIDNLFFSDNAANAEVSGLEGTLTWLPDEIEGLMLTGAFSFLDSEVVDSLVTQYVQEGDELAFSPEFQGNLNARYEWDHSSGLAAFWMANLSYSGESATDIVVPNRTYIDSWTMLGVAAGVQADNWTAEVYVDNVTDERAQLSGTFQMKRSRIAISRPLTIGLRVSMEI